MVCFATQNRYIYSILAIIMKKIVTIVNKEEHTSESFIDLTQAAKYAGIGVKTLRKIINGEYRYAPAGYYETHRLIITKGVFHSSRRGGKRLKTQ